MLDVEIVSRQGALSEDDWWDLHLSVHGGLLGSRGGARLPDKLLRLGVRYADMGAAARSAYYWQRPAVPSADHIKIQRRPDPHVFPPPIGPSHTGIRARHHRGRSARLSDFRATAYSRGGTR